MNVEILGERREAVARFDFANLQRRCESVRSEIDVKCGRQTFPPHGGCAGGRLGATTARQRKATRYLSRLFGLSCAGNASRHNVAVNRAAIRTGTCEPEKEARLAGLLLRHGLTARLEAVAAYRAALERERAKPLHIGMTSRKLD